MIENSIRKLVCYGKEKNLFDPRDEIYVTNRILEALGLSDIKDSGNYKDVDLESTLKEILDFAAQSGLIEDNVTERDLFDTKVMGCLLPPPSVVTEKFFKLHSESSEKATEFYYDFSRNSDYIRTYRVKKDLKWKSQSPFGELDITINLSKPEKDPKAIAAAKAAKQSDYPKCLLCKECEGYAGRLNFPARQNHRIIPVTLGGEQWFWQYSPYVYYNEHCIVFNADHTPMKVDHTTFVKLLSFVKLFPHYFLGSNAGLPVVGGSILTHEHYQGGNYVFPMEKAPVEYTVPNLCTKTVSVGSIKWPMAAVRIEGEDEQEIIKTADKILEYWKDYCDETVGIIAKTNGEEHNTVTPIARKRNGKYQLDLVFRNNITSEEHPLGVFHPHEELHHIKKENIGLIEVMGLAVLPSRLKGEMEKLKTDLLNGSDIKADADLKKHAEWAEEIKQNYTLTAENIDGIIKDEIGKVFAKVLACAGVFKRDNEGQEALKKFLFSIK